MNDVLIIFVDGLPHTLLSHMPNLGMAREQWSIIPGFGYSVNIHAELFAGLLPDDVGYFGEWMYNPESSPGRRIRKLLPMLDTLFRPYILNRGLQYLLARRYHPGHAIPNIRLRDLDKFALEGLHILDDPRNYPHSSLFSDFPELHTIPMPDLPKGKRDQALYSAGLNALEEASSLFIPLPDLDGFGHTYGIDKKPYRDHLLHLDKLIATLVQRFTELHPRSHVFVISDHGMVNVSQSVYLDIEQSVAPASEKTYVYFSDANLLRVWVFDSQLRTSIQTYLETLKCGQLVTDKEREIYGLTSARFGDLIFVLYEGLAFEPSTFARHRPAGMHGYHPLAPGQQAICVHYGERWRGAAPHRMHDVCNMLRGALGSQW